MMNDLMISQDRWRLDNRHTLDWLLETNQPAIRYRTLTQLLGIPASEREIETLYRSIWATKDVEAMLKHLNDDGIWEHSPKEYGMHSSLRYLTALGEYGLHQDERIERAVAFALGFLTDKESAPLTEDYSGCSDALLLRALVMLGYQNHPLLRGLVDRYTARQIYDGGFICRRLLDKNPTRKSCYKAGLAALQLYAECFLKGVDLPGRERLLGYFLKRDVFFASDDPQKVLLDGRLGWRGIDNFFPVEPMRIGLAQTMAALSMLGVGDDEALSRGWAMLEDKKTRNGHYKLEGTLSRQPSKIGKPGEENKWVTFYVLLAIKTKANCQNQNGLQVDLDS